MTPTPTAADSPLHHLVAALQTPAAFPHPVTGFRVVETHISLVLLTGPFAYKFKKAVDFGFVNFSTLARRRACCEAELRLNRRLSPELYTAVLAIGGDADHPRFGAEPVLEYCVQMRQFPAAAELDQALARGEVDRAAFESLAEDVAEFHRHAEAAASDSPLGSAALVGRDCLENLEDLKSAGFEADRVALADWTRAALARLAPLIRQRHDRGRVRECHGDMHLTNMVWLDGRIRLFDCIEFNPELAWIDVISDIAFLIMDLDHRGRPDLGRCFLNRYLEAGGDYGGVPLLRLFLVYRSLVRAKVAVLQAGQGGAGAAAALTRAARHVALARRYSEPAAAPPLVITCGLSGSGKTTLTDLLIPHADFIRLRSDVERRRLHGRAAREPSHSGLGTGLYGAAQTARTYDHLLAVAETLLRAGHPVLVDATFLRRDQRAPFQALAQRLNVPFRILDCEAPAAVLRARVAARAQTGADASEADLAVLERQLAQREAPGPADRAVAMTIDTSVPLAPAQLSRKLFPA